MAKDHVNIFEIPDSLSLQIHIDRSFGLCLKFEVQWEGLSKSRAAGVVRVIVYQCKLNAIKRESEKRAILDS